MDYVLAYSLSNVNYMYLNLSAPKKQTVLPKIDLKIK